MFTEFSVNMGYAIGFHYSVIPSAGSDAIAGTCESERHPQTRFFDTANFLFGWQFRGTSDPETVKSIEWVNRMHDHLATRFPASFDKNEDILYPIVMLVILGDRMRDAVGARRRSENDRLAVHHFWRDIASHMRGSHGPLVDFPATVEDAERFAEDASIGSGSRHPPVARSPSCSSSSSTTSTSPVLCIHSGGRSS
ncbi:MULTISPECIES: oxygenase MpaB family protein [unclassified Microbacterium]|uniref:oxygenase MpaB family protein n=1 Tax=unclassified Microbacterium TaxID=2609290 RepID=UPI0035B3E561